MFIVLVSRAHQNEAGHTVLTVEGMDFLDKGWMTVITLVGG